MHFPAACAGLNKHKKCCKDTEITASGLVLTDFVEAHTYQIIEE